MATYRVTFDRVGRYGGRNGTPSPAPRDLVARDESELLERIAAAVRPYLGSPAYDVDLDTDTGHGFITCGFRPGGSFTVEALADAEQGATADD